jgi:hypothetical protein
MNQEPESGGGRMKNEPGVQAESEQGYAKRRGPTGWDIAGIVLGVLILSIVLLGFRYSLYGFIYHHFPYALLLVGVLLFLSICISIPTRYYEGGFAHAIGLVALSIASAIAVFGVITVVGCLIGISFYNIEDEWWLIPMMIIAFGLVLLTFFGSCAYVLAKKVQPRLAHLAVGTLAVFLVAGLYALLIYYAR